MPPMRNTKDKLFAFDADQLISDRQLDDIKNVFAHVAEIRRARIG